MQKIGRQIMFNPNQYKWLEKRAKELNCTIAEVVRRIIDERREKND